MPSNRFVSPSPPPEGLDRELLVILVEECAEVIDQLAQVQHRALKALRFGVNEVQPGQELTNAERLADEIGDASHLFARLEDRGLISGDRVMEAIRRKRDKLAVYLQAEGDDGR